MSRKDATQMRRKLELFGFIVGVAQNGHYNVIDPDTGATVILMSQTPSDWRFSRKVESDLKKQGYDINGPSPFRKEKIMSSTEQVDSSALKRALAQRQDQLRDRLQLEMRWDDVDGDSVVDFSYKLSQKAEEEISPQTVQLMLRNVFFADSTEAVMNRLERLADQYELASMEDPAVLEHKVLDEPVVSGETLVCPDCLREFSDNRKLAVHSTLMHGISECPVCDWKGATNVFGLHTTHTHGLSVSYARSLSIVRPVFTKKWEPHLWYLRDLLIDLMTSTNVLSEHKIIRMAKERGVECPADDAFGKLLEWDFGGRGPVQKTVEGFESAILMLRNPDAEPEPVVEPESAPTSEELLEELEDMLTVSTEAELSVEAEELTLGVEAAQLNRYDAEVAIAQLRRSVLRLTAMAGQSGNVDSAVAHAERLLEAIDKIQ